MHAFLLLFSIGIGNGAGPGRAADRFCIISDLFQSANFSLLKNKNVNWKATEKWKWLKCALAVVLLSWHPSCRYARRVRERRLYAFESPFQGVLSISTILWLFVTPSKIFIYDRQRFLYIFCSCYVVFEVIASSQQYCLCLRVLFYFYFFHRDGVI